MKSIVRLSALATALLTCSFALGQATAPAAAPVKPANAAGQCKDGTYSTAASKSGACRGHNGVKEWYTATAPTTKTAAPTAPAAAPAAAAAPTAPSPTTQARTQTQTAAQSAAQTSSQSGTPPATTSIQKTPKTTTPMPTTAAAGGGPGMVWVNSGTNVYHCPGTKYYGKTKAGSYMSEADAKSKGARADHGNACTK